MHASLCKAEIAYWMAMCRGLESVADAVDHLHSGRSFGKVVVQLSPVSPEVTATAKL